MLLDATRVRLWLCERDRDLPHSTSSLKRHRPLLMCSSVQPLHFYTITNIGKITFANKTSVKSAALVCLHILLQNFFCCAPITSDFYPWIGGLAFFSISHIKYATDVINPSFRDITVQFLPHRWTSHTHTPQMELSSKRNFGRKDNLQLFFFQLDMTMWLPIRLAGPWVVSRSQITSVTPYRHLRTEQWWDNRGWTRQPKEPSSKTPHLSQGHGLSAVQHWGTEISLWIKIAHASSFFFLSFFTCAIFICLSLSRSLFFFFLQTINKIHINLF